MHAVAQAADVARPHPLLFVLVAAVAASPVLLLLSVLWVIVGLAVQVLLRRRREPG